MPRRPSGTPPGPRRASVGPRVEDRGVTRSRSAGRPRAASSTRRSDIPTMDSGSRAPSSVDTAARDRADASAPRSGRALIVGGWVRDRLLGRPVEGCRPRGLRHRRRAPARDPARRFGSVNTVGESFTVYKVRGRRRLAAAPRIEGRPRASRVRSDRRPGAGTGGSRAAPRLHDQRHRLGSAHGRVRGPVRRTRAISSAACSGRSIRGRSATTACECCGLSSLPRGSSSRVDAATDELCRRLPLDDLPAERIWGEIEKLLLQASRPSIGFALALELGDHRSPLPRDESAASAVRRNRSGTRRATSGSIR